MSHIRKSFLHAFGPDLSSELPDGQETYRVTVRNETTIVWNEISLFYDLVGMPGVVPLIVQGAFPPGTGFTFHLCPCLNLNSFTVGIFFNDINGGLLTARAPEEGSFPATIPGAADPCHPIIAFDF